MNQETDELSLINNRFAGSEVLIERAFLENSVFRSLCEDYRECAEALERWKNSESENAAERQKEYAEMLIELEHDIKDWLEAMAQATGQRKV